MRHPTIDHLADHVLDAAGPALRERVGEHLGSGCERCRRLVAALERLRRIAARNGEPGPSLGALRSVKRLTITRTRGGASRIAMLLSFDRLLCPAAAGLRGASPSSRHLVFYSQDFALDLRMDCARSARWVTVCGQLLNRDTGPVLEVPAYLLAGNEILSHATTGHDGTFQLECRRQEDLKVRLVVSGGELIEVRLDRAARAVGAVRLREPAA